MSAVMDDRDGNGQVKQVTCPDPSLLGAGFGCGFVGFKASKGSSKSYSESVFSKFGFWLPQPALPIYD